MASSSSWSLGTPIQQYILDFLPLVVKSTTGLLESPHLPLISKRFAAHFKSPEYKAGGLVHIDVSDSNRISARFLKWLNDNIDRISNRTLVFITDKIDTWTIDAIQVYLRGRICHEDTNFPTSEKIVDLLYGLRIVQLPTVIKVKHSTSPVFATYILATCGREMTGIGSIPKCELATYTVVHSGTTGCDSKTCLPSTACIHHVAGIQLLPWHMSTIVP